MGEVPAPPPVSLTEDDFVTRRSYSPFLSSSTGPAAVAAVFTVLPADHILQIASRKSHLAEEPFPSSCRLVQSTRLALSSISIDLYVSRYRMTSSSYRTASGTVTAKLSQPVLADTDGPVVAGPAIYAGPTSVARATTGPLANQVFECPGLVDANIWSNVV